MKNKKVLKLLFRLLLFLLFAAVSAYFTLKPVDSTTLEEIPEYTGSPYVYLYENVPDFSEEDLTLTPFETYSSLDLLGRCGVAYANICQELMPTDDRESIGQVKPSGWQTARYDGLVDGNYLYNRCHLIGFQLAGENANAQNLITGTRYMNVDGMLPFENMVADYVEDTGNHVLYRVTPIYNGADLVASGVQMEAISVEDGGSGVKFNVYVYNVQPGVEIDYATGNSRLAEELPALPNSTTSGSQAYTFILNTKSEKFHDPGCSGASKIGEDNKQSYTGQREDLIAKGYEPCGQCQP